VDGEYRGSQFWCKKDIANYRSLTNKWTRDRRLRTWWGNLKPEAQTLWFQKWQQMPQGSKRRFDECFGEELTREQEYCDEHAVDDWLHLRAYKAFRRQENPFMQLADQDLEEEFSDLVKNNQSHCRWDRNQWHVPIYRGITRGVGGRTSQEAISGARRRLANELETREFLSNSRRNIDACAATVQGVPNIPDGTIQSEATEADQAPMQPPVAGSSSLFAREAVDSFEFHL